MLQQDIMDILLLNVRVPQERRGDHNAQIASCRLGARRFNEVVAVHGLDDVLAAFDEIISRTADRMRGAIDSIPDGIYQFSDFMDGDGIATSDIPICLSLTVKGEHIHLDFAGTSPQVSGNINTTMNAVQASVCYALIAVLDAELPSNQGVLDVVGISADAGTLLNSVFPAPVAARAHACQRVIDVVLGALSQALPQKVIAAAKRGKHHSRVLRCRSTQWENHISIWRHLAAVWVHGRPKMARPALPILPIYRWNRSSRNIRCGWKNTVSLKIQAEQGLFAAPW